MPSPEKGKARAGCGNPPVDSPAGVYKPRRARSSPLFRLVQDHFTDLHAVWEDRFAHTHGDWRPVVREVANKFLACGILDHGFARVRCDACAHASRPTARSPTGTRRYI